jgi:hypothetical protein
MKKFSQLALIAVPLMFVFNGCQILGDVFQTGVGVGIVIAVIIILLILFIIGRIGRRR